MTAPKEEIAYYITHYTSVAMYENRDAIYRYEKLHNDSLQTYYVTRGKKKQQTNDKKVVNKLNQSLARIIRTILKVTLPRVKQIVHCL